MIVLNLLDDGKKKSGWNDNNYDFSYINNYVILTNLFG